MTLSCLGASSSAPLSQLSTNGSLTVEVTVRPARLPCSGVPHILTLHSDEGPSPLMIGAWKNSLLVRLGRSVTTGRRTFRETGSLNAFTSGKVAVIAVAAGPKGTSLYLDGQLQRSSPDLALEPGRAGLGRLLLGISPKGSGEWQGDILGLQIHNRALNEAEIRRSFETSRNSEMPGRDLSASAIAAYRFTEGTGSIVRDGSGHGPIQRCREIYGRNLALEISPHNEADLQLSRWTVAAARRLRIPVVPTADAHYRRGMLLARQAGNEIDRDMFQRRAAQGAFERALRIDRGNPEYFLEFGRLRLKQGLGRLDAQRMFNRALEAARQRGDGGLIAETETEIADIHFRRYMAVGHRYLLTGDALQFDPDEAIDNPHYAKQTLGQTKVAGLVS